MTYFLNVIAEIMRFVIFLGQGKFFPICLTRSCSVDEVRHLWLKTFCATPNSTSFHLILPFYLQVNFNEYSPLFGWVRISNIHHYSVGSEYSPLFGWFRISNIRHYSVGSEYSLA